MKLGVRLHDLASGSVDEVISKCQEYGFEYVQLVFKKALEDSSGNSLLFTKDTALEVGKKFKDAGIKIAMLGAYFNPVHSNKELVETNTRYFEEHLRYAYLLDAKYVGTETGSYNDDKWTYNPKNQTEEGYQDTMKTFHRLVKVAEETGTNILIEPAYGHVIYSVDQLNRAVNELNSKNVFVTIDIFNLLYLGNYQDYKEIFTYACKTFNSRIKVFHLKDFYPTEEKLVQTGLGKGIIDFKFIINTIREYAPDATMIFEGVKPEDMKDSLILIKQI